MDWSAYPEHHGNSKASNQVLDLEFYRKRLLDDADRLFNPASPELKFVFLGPSPQYVIPAHMDLGAS